MKLTNNLTKYFVIYDKETSKIYQVSNRKINTKHSIIELSDVLLDEINRDVISIDSTYIFKKKIYKKDGIIRLPDADKKFTEIKNDKMQDINLELFVKNKLLDISINTSSLGTWYNHRMKDKFSFENIKELNFQIKQKKKIIKKITVPIELFLGEFKCTIDLSDIKDFTNIQIFTKKVLKKYSLIMYIDKDKKNNNSIKSNNIFEKVTVANKNYDMIFEKTDILNKVKVINNFTSNDKKLSINMLLYITGKDPNNILSTTIIDLVTLQNKKTFIVTMSSKFLNENSNMYCNYKIKIKGIN